MKRWQRPSATATILGLVGLLLLTLVLAVAALIWNMRQTALAEAEARAVRFVRGAEAALNRNLLGVDVLLASTDELLGLSELMLDWIDPASASRKLHDAAQQNLMVSNVALLDGQARIIAAANPSSGTLEQNFSNGFLNEVLAQPVSTLVVSPPMLNPASAEQVLYLARYLKLADSSKVVAVAEVPVAMQTAILVQGGDISGLEVTLERSNGQLLASAPTLPPLASRQLTPAAIQLPDAAPALALPARVSAAPAMVVTRPILYNDVLISASIPFDAALQGWRAQRNVILALSLVLALLMLATGGFAIWYLTRLGLARQAQTQAQVTLDQALQSMVSGFLLLDTGNNIVRWNRRFEEIYPWLDGVLHAGLPFRRLVELSVEHMFPTGSSAERTHWIEQRLAQQTQLPATHEQVMPNGQFIQVTEQRTPDGGLVITYHDLTELRTAAAEIEHLAFFDALTGLPNRRLLMDRLQHALAASARSGRYGALLFLDLDHFKTLNDTLGHDMGDLLLQQVALRLKASVREEDTVARLGGDEFVLMLEDLASDNHEAAAVARRIGEKVLERLNGEYQLAAHSYRNTPSIGAALFGVIHQSAADLLKQADIAMYQVKASGRNALCFFDPQMQADITARALLEKDLHAALALEQFELYYQPQVTQQGALCGAEVLLRWQHPQRGRVPPSEFIPAAEECGLILPIGQWVLRSACAQLARWMAGAPAQLLPLSVNVSARQFRQPAFVAEVAQVLLQTGVHADLLKLELTESLVLEDVADTIAKMTSLKAMGLKFSVDDFGTGHSSLAYLTSLPLDQLKIDQSFVRNIGIKATDGVIVQTIIGMAHNLGLEVIAEGVETAAQQAFLAQHGCSLYQGYLFGRPAPLTEFEAMLNRSPLCLPD